MITIGCSRKDEETLKLTLEMSNEVYRSGDDIRAGIILENISSEPILVNGRLSLGIQSDPITAIDFLIITPSGQKGHVYIRYSIQPPEENNFIVLKSGETVGDEYVLNDIYDNLYEEGTYSIQAFYHNQWDPENGEITWKGQVESETINFTVNP
jgi:hypothetical protein